jgi:hypothetical protein
MTSKHENSLHDHYVRAVNVALAAGRDRDARELAVAYADELSEVTPKRLARAGAAPREENQ